MHRLMIVWVVMSSVLFQGYAANALGTEERAEQKVILVTGASSGIGRMIAETLATEGYLVYAGARKDADLKALNSIDNIRSIRLDVTVPQEIAAAVETIGNEAGGLNGLVNNAGVLFAGPNIENDMERVKWLFEVNVFGVQRVTQAFAPMLIDSGGRIANIGSVAGNIGIKYLGAYSMSKHAIEAYTDSLAAEMEMLGVQVSIIAPGDFSTNIWNSQIRKAEGPGLVSSDSPFSEDIAKWIDSVSAMESKEPDAVAAAVKHALFDENPRRRYLVVPNEAEAKWVIGSAVKRLAELNTDQEYAYTADELAVMIRAAMSEESYPVTPSSEELGNATYNGIQESPVTLANGKWEGKPYVEGGASRPTAGLVEELYLTGDMNGDGRDEAIVMLWESSGGAGSNSYLALMGKTPDGVTNIGTALIGDRVKLRSGKIVDGAIYLDVLQAGETDAMCCPTTLATRVWSLQDGLLREGKIEVTGKLSLAALAGSEWALSELEGGMRTAEGAEVTLAFASGRISGKSACNRYSASIEEGEVSGSLIIGPAMGTRMACPGELMDVERLFLAALSQVSSFSFHKGSLLMNGLSKEDKPISMLFSRRK